MCLKPHLNLNEVYYYHEELYSLKFGMELKRVKYSPSLQSTVKKKSYDKEVFSP